MAENTAKGAGPRTPGKAAGKGSLDTPLSGRQRILPKFSPDPDAFGHATEGFARFMGTPQFLLYMTVFCLFWLAWNTFASRALSCPATRCPGVSAAALWHASWGEGTSVAFTVSV